MTVDPIQAERIQPLNDRPAQSTGQYVLYWMQRAQRARYNHALEYAIQQANELGQPLLVVFGLSGDYPEANLRHYTFMLEGLQETGQDLAERGIKLAVRPGSPPQVALAAGQPASLIVCDRAYLRQLRGWRRQVAEAAPCRVVQVESDAIVPVQAASTKAEYAARTIRSKLKEHLARYRVALPANLVERDSLDLKFDGLDLANLDKILAGLNVDRSVKPVSQLFRGGPTAAEAAFQEFLETRLNSYDNNRNQPQTDYVSHTSMYLHFGQISPLYLLLELEKAPARLHPAKEAFVEELLVQRELALNFVAYTPGYDRYDCLPKWARATLAAHRDDARPYLYTRQELEQAQTHDPYWNAAMREMIHTGYMHNYMRMYWGKKVLEWSPTPQQAFQTLLALNDKYFLDGRDPNGYANVAWIFGLHDRPWPERAIFGKVRYMSASGLERKSDINAYVEKVAMLVKKAAA